MRQGESLTTWGATSYIARIFAGQNESLTRDDILDNITLYWLTNTGVSAARFYWENKVAFFAPKNVAIPVAVSVFPDEIYAPPRSWVEKAYPRLIHYNRLPKGGHFAAWEQPKLFSRRGSRGLQDTAQRNTLGLSAPKRRRMLAGSHESRAHRMVGRNRSCSDCGAWR